MTTEEEKLYLKYFKEAADKIIQEAFDCGSKEANDFINKIRTYPFNVLGGSVRSDFEDDLQVGPPPESHCVLVDPCLVSHVASMHGPKMAYGLSSKLYEYVGLTDADRFPVDVISHVSDSGKAKLFHYTERDVRVIHCAQPNFEKYKQRNSKTRQKVVERLAFAYANIFREFLKCDSKSLRLAPLTLSRKLSGIYKEFISRLTYEAIIIAFDVLDINEKEQLLGDSIQVSLCVYNQKDFKSFILAGFNYDENSQEQQLQSIYKHLQLGTYCSSTSQGTHKLIQNKTIRVKVKKGQSSYQLAERLTEKYKLPPDDIPLLAEKLTQCIHQQKANEHLYGSVAEDDSDESSDDQSSEGEDSDVQENVVHDDGSVSKTKRAQRKLRYTQNKHIELKLKLAESRQTLSSLVSERVAKEMQKEDLIAQLKELGLSEEEIYSKGATRGSRVSFSDLADMNIIDEYEEEEGKDMASWSLADAIVTSPTAVGTVHASAQIKTSSIDKNKINNMSLSYIANSTGKSKKQFAQSFTKENKLKKRNSMMFSESEQEQVMDILSDLDQVKQLATTTTTNNNNNNSHVKHEDTSDKIKDHKVLDSEWLWDEELWSWLYTNGKLLDQRLSDPRIEFLPIAKKPPQESIDSPLNLMVDANQWLKSEECNLPTPQQLCGFLSGCEVSPQPRYHMTSSSSAMSSKTVSTPYLASLSRTLQRKRIHRPPKHLNDSTFQPANGSEEEGKILNESVQVEDLHLSTTAEGAEKNGAHRYTSSSLFKSKTKTNKKPGGWRKGKFW